MDYAIRTLRPNEIECRIGQVKKDNSGLSLLLYKDARCDMNILDETFGPMNWKRRHCRDNANCVVSIWDSEKKEWIEKEDTGTESNTEAEKGLASDSFKRACVNVGIGRELYTAPFIWITADKCSISNGKCYDKFDVVEIDYNSNREISVLVIVNEKTGNVVFSYGKKAPKKAPPKNDPPKQETPPDENPEPPKKEEEPVYKCCDCGDALVYMTDKTGKVWTPVETRDFSYRRFGRVLCSKCMKKAQLQDELKKMGESA